MLFEDRISSDVLEEKKGQNFEKKIEKKTTTTTKHSPTHTG